MTNKAKKCKHPACKCMVPDGEDYCSQTCKDAAGMAEISCKCDHPDCRPL